MQLAGNSTTYAPVEDYYKRYPWAREQAQRTMARITARDSKPRSAGGWKRNYHPGAAVRSDLVEGVGGAATNTRGGSVVGTGKPAASSK